MIAPSIQPGPGDEALRTRLVDLVGSFGRPRMTRISEAEVLKAAACRLEADRPAAFGAPCGDRS